ncbi:MAG: hypothetical protein R3250_11185 [Melioribacteraceae bacterium]|nr:hypothetical protein [Melioribacteraceae bacterium]
MKRFKLSEINQAYQNFAIALRLTTTADANHYAFRIYGTLIDDYNKRNISCYYNYRQDSFMIVTNPDKPEETHWKLTHYIHEYWNPEGVYFLEKLALERT